MTDAPTGEQEQGVRWPLLTFAVGYNIAHHNGAFFQDLGSIGDTRIADWIDLATPFVVLGPFAWALSRGRATRTNIVLFLIGSLIYVEGHGIHLAANSIGNVVSPITPIGGDVIHLWDEVVGHYLWYGGGALAATAVYRAIRWQDMSCGPLSSAMAMLTGLTWATNGLEGGTAVFSLVLAMVGLVAVWPKRIAAVPRLAMIALTVAAVLLAAWGIRHGGFPQPSSL